MIASDGIAAASAVVPAFDWSLLSGPLGGTLAASFIAGAVAGYGFCVRTILRLSNKRIDSLEAQIRQEKIDCDKRVAKLERKLDVLQQMLLGQRALGPLTTFDDIQEPLYGTPDNPKPQGR